MNSIKSKVRNTTFRLTQNLDNNWHLESDVEIVNNSFRQIINGEVYDPQNHIKTAFSYMDRLSTVHLEDTTEEMQSEINGYIKDYIVAAKEFVQSKLEPEEEHVPTEEELAEQARIKFEATKRSKLESISKYDTSDNVNQFFYNDMPLWLNKETRVGLMNSTNILKSAGYETTDLWFEDIHVTLPCDTVIQMLGALEIYALQCYNATAQHLSAVKALETIEEVEAYDYTTGYPEKLRF